MNRCAYVGLLELAAIFDVQPDTVYRWRMRSVLPEPDRVVSETPMWEPQTIIDWAASTGRAIVGTFPE